MTLKPTFATESSSEQVQILLVQDNTSLMIAPPRLAIVTQIIKFYTKIQANGVEYFEYTNDLKLNYSMFVSLQ
jgi:hypothetical protein